MVNGYSVFIIEKLEIFLPNRHYSFLQQRMILLKKEIESDIDRIIGMEGEIKASFYKERERDFDVRAKLRDICSLAIYILYVLLEGYE